MRAVVEPAFWLGQPRTNVGSFIDYFDALIGWEPFRAAQFGIRHHCTIALNPKEANDPRCREVLDLLPRYLAKDGVVAVGEIGYDSMTPEEDEVFAAQLALAVEHEPARRWCTRPHRDKAGRHPAHPRRGRASRASRPGGCVVDHLNEVTVGAGRATPAAGWASPSTPTPRCRRTGWWRSCASTAPERMLVNSAADWGRSDPLHDRRAPAEAMLAAGFTDDDVDRVLWRNPVEFYGQAAGCCSTSPTPTAPTRRPSTGNSILRGRALMRLRHPDGSTVHLPTAPTCTPPRTSTACSTSSTVRRPVRATLGADVLGLGPVAARPVAPALAARRRRRAPAAPRARRARGWRW